MKLAVIVREHPRVSIVMIEFLIVDFPSAFNGVIGKLILKALKAMTSIYHLTMKFSTIEGTRQVWGSQYDSRECYNKSLKLAEKEKKLPQIMEVGMPSMGPIEVNIDPLCKKINQPQGVSGSQWAK